MAKRSKKQREAARVQRQEERTQAARMRWLRLLGLVVLVVVGIGLVLLWGNRDETAVNEVVTSTPPNILGSPNAPVRLVEYGDFA